jgi:uncharacterized protein (DUF2147 family)
VENFMRPISTLAAASLAAAILVAPAAAAGSPEGLWRTGPGDAEYELKYCGDGDDLCGWLVYTADESAEAQAYVNKLSLDTARSTGPSTWQGSMVVGGNSASGTIALVSDDKLMINACVMFVVCGEFALYRAD